MRAATDAGRAGGRRAITLERMADGGIHDQLGGGFCRYSVDREWPIPHFEKMLYDNGPLLGLYADLARVDRRRAVRAASRAGSSRWLTREMRAPRWRASTRASMPTAKARKASSTSGSATRCARCCRADEYAVAAPHFGLDGAPNFEGHAWNLRVASRSRDVASAQAIALADAQARIGSRARSLFAARERRHASRPRRQDPHLVERARDRRAGARIARLEKPAVGGSRVLGRRRARAHAWRHGRLLATRKGERAHLNAYLDDYAFLLAALDELMQTRFRLDDYAWAREIADVLLDQFEDREARAASTSPVTTTSG